MSRIKFGSSQKQNEEFNPYNELIKNKGGKIERYASYKDKKSEHGSDSEYTSISNEDSQPIISGSGNYGAKSLKLKLDGNKRSNKQILTSELKK